MLLRTRIARTMLVPALVTFALPGVAGAQLTKAGVVTTLQGTATVARATTPQPLPLKFKDTVFVQDRITTGNDSIARILLGGKAIVTVRERSVLTITEVPGTSTIDLGIGKIALAVVKERMKSGETIEIRTPNAVAGIRGTVVITEVDQKTAQAGPPATAFTSRFTVLQGTVLVSQYDPFTRRPGPPVNLGPLQTTAVTGSAPPRPPQTITPEAAKKVAGEYRTTIKEAPAAANAAVTNAQMQQAVSHVGAVVSPPAPTASQGKSDTGQQRGNDAPGDLATTTSSSGPAGSAPSSSGTSGGSTTTSSGSSSGTASGPPVGASSTLSTSSSGTSSGSQGSGKAAGGPTISTPALPAPTPAPAPVATPSVVTAPTVVTPTVTAPAVAPVTPTVAAPSVVSAPKIVTPTVVAPPPVIVSPIVTLPQVTLPQVISQPNNAIKPPSADDKTKHKLEESKHKKR